MVPFCAASALRRPLYVLGTTAAAARSPGRRPVPRSGADYSATSALRPPAKSTGLVVRSPRRQGVLGLHRRVEPRGLPPAWCYEFEVTWSRRRPAGVRRGGRAHCSTPPISACWCRCWLNRLQRSLHPSANVKLFSLYSGHHGKQKSYTHRLLPVYRRRPQCNTARYFLGNRVCRTAA